jgi:hypothetical protein
MTSQINTNGINVNYPIPGQNNSSQGFRDNFAQIATQLNTGAGEITDLQSKAVLKAALNNSNLNNDMGNALISNASTSGFRATTYNLGNALAGTVLVDVNRADVQFGALQGNIVLQFGNWAPTNTQSNVVLRLTFANSNPAYISLPSSCISSNNNFGVTLLENYANVGGVATISAPANVNIIELRFSTIDCGNTITVEPINRPFQSTEIQQRTPPPTGLPGDVEGTVAVDANYFYVCTSSFNSTVYNKTVINTYATGNVITLNNTTSLATNAPIIFSGSVDTANTNLVANTVYYIKTISSPNITISTTRTGGTAGAVFTPNNKSNVNAVLTAYIGSNIWTRVSLTGW